MGPESKHRRETQSVSCRRRERREAREADAGALLYAEEADRRLVARSSQEDTLSERPSGDEPCLEDTLGVTVLPPDAEER